MKIFVLLLVLVIPNVGFSLEDIKVINLNLKYRTAEQIIPYLIPHKSPDAKISGSGRSLMIRLSANNVNELLIIIGDIDKKDFLQIAVSITMNINAIHNVNTRSVQIGENTWTKLNYGITYSNRVREKLPNGNLVEKIEYINVIESIQIYTTIESNTRVILKFRDNQQESEITEVQNEFDENNHQNNQVKGQLNQWISINEAINFLYHDTDEDPKIKLERQRLTRNMGIKIQILQ